jgi:hypothetical protein
MTDAPVLKDTFLYWLSQQGGLDKFAYVILLSAAKDQYVPAHSARIQVCSAAVKDALRSNATAPGRVLTEMVRTFAPDTSTKHHILLTV